MKYTCPCCGYRTLPEPPPGTFAVCPVCFWEDGDLQFEDPDFEEGANQESLRQAQADFQEFGAISARFRRRVRKPMFDELWDPGKLMKRGIYDLQAEPQDALYQGLIDLAVSFCSLALVVLRSETTLTDRGLRVLESLKPFVEQRVKSTRWPGTELIGAEADLFYCRLDAESSQLIKSATDHLYGWCHPDLPEDLCLLRADHEPWLVSVAHEHDGYMVLTESEKENLLAFLPSLRLGPGL